MASSDGFHFSQPNKTKVGDMCDLWLLKGPLKNLLHSENKVPCCTLSSLSLWYYPLWCSCYPFDRVHLCVLVCAFCDTKTDLV